MNAVRQALFSKLAGDATLVGLLGTVASGSNIWHRVAPRDAPEPFVIIDKQAGTPVYDLAAQAMNPQLWLVKAVDKRQSGSKAEDIDARIYTVLDNATMTLTSGALLYCRRVSDVDYGEVDSGDIFQHVGGIYRLITTP